MAGRKWTPYREWLTLGIVLGNLLPDADNLAVAVVTVVKLSTEGLHCTFTHSLFTGGAIIAVFYIVAWETDCPRWSIATRMKGSLTIPAVTRSRQRRAYARPVTTNSPQVCEMICGTLARIFCIANSFFRYLTLVFN